MVDVKKLQELIAEAQNVDWRGDRRLDVPRIEPICGLVYSGPDPLGVGVGLCVISIRLAHTTHRDRHGRTWRDKT